jgi:hypothetical protein
MLVVIGKIEVKPSLELDGTLVEFNVMYDETKIGSIGRFPYDIWLLKLVENVWIYENCLNEIWEQFRNHVSSSVCSAY